MAKKKKKEGWEVGGAHFTLENKMLFARTFALIGTLLLPTLFIAHTFGLSPLALHFHSLLPLHSPMVMHACPLFFTPTLLIIYLEISVKDEITMKGFNKYK